jgi:glycosyltransferase involved in cell wall biosynthesis
MFSMYFDPAAAMTDVIGSVRPRLLARFLPAEGWTPLVVTGGSRDVEERAADLLVRTIRTSWPIAAAKARSGLSVADVQQRARSMGSSGSPAHGPVRAAMVEVAAEVAGLVPDSLAWAVRAAGAGLDLVRREQPVAIYSTSPSPAAHLAAWLVAIRCGLPWVAELRDLWAAVPTRPGTHLRGLLDRGAERFVLGRAAALVTVSAPLADRLRATYRRTPVHAILSGFDPDEHAQDDRLAPDFRLLYAGRIHERQDVQRVLGPLADAIDSGRIDGDRTRVELLTMGTLSESDRAFVRSRGLERVIVEEPFVTRGEALARERGAQVLLHLRWDEPGQSGILTGKLFEYLAARRPILSTGRYVDSVSALLVETGAGTATTSDAETGEYLSGAWDAFSATGRVPYHGRRDAVDRYDARTMAAAIAGVLNDAAAVAGTES